MGQSMRGLHTVPMRLSPRPQPALSSSGLVRDDTLPSNLVPYHCARQGSVVSGGCRCVIQASQQHRCTPGSC